MQLCGATRLGHGVRLVEDIRSRPTVTRSGPVAPGSGTGASPLELCPTSNLQTGVCDTVAEHPFGLLADLRFRVTVNCDNRLMSRTTLSREMGCWATPSATPLDDLRRLHA